MLSVCRTALVLPAWLMMWTVTLDRNYWGSANPGFDKLILAPEGVTVDSDVYYVDEAMTRLNTDSTGGGSSGGSSSYTISTEDTENGSLKVSPTRASLWPEGDHHSHPRRGLCAGRYHRH